MARSTPTPRHSARMPTPLPLRGDWGVPVTERAAVCIALVQPQLVRGQFASPRTHEPSHCTPLGMPPQSVVRCAAAACGSSRRAVDAGTRVPPERNPLRNQHRRRPDRARVGHHPTQAGHAHLSAHSSAKAAAATPLPLRGHPQQPPSPLPPSRPQPTATLPTLQALHPHPHLGRGAAASDVPAPPNSPWEGPKRFSSAACRQHKGVVRRGGAPTHRGMGTAKYPGGAPRALHVPAPEWPLGVASPPRGAVAATDASAAGGPGKRTALRAAGSIRVSACHVTVSDGGPSRQG